MTGWPGSGDYKSQRSVRVCVWFQGAAASLDHRTGLRRQDTGVSDRGQGALTGSMTFTWMESALLLFMSG